MKNILRQMIQDEWITTWWVMWLIFFTCTVILAAFVQLILLPHFLPGIHYGHGLFVPDSTGFHQVAQEQAAAIKRDGWQAWQLRPRNYYPAGVATVFYYLWRPEPFSLIPFNSALHATSGCLIFFLLSFFIRNRFAALGGAAIFVLNPASLEWTSQIHRDGTFILGNLLVLNSWLVLLRAVETGKWLNYLYSFFFMFAGIVCIWAARPYWIQVVIVANIFIIVLLLFLLAMAWLKKSSRKYHHIAAVFVGILMLVMQFPFIDEKTSFTERFENEKVNIKSTFDDQTEVPKDKIITIGEFKGRIIIEAPSKDSAIIEAPSKDSAIIEAPSKDRVITYKKSIRMRVTEGNFKGTIIPLKIAWNSSPFIPNFIESKLYGLATYRLTSTFSGGKSLVDPDIQFNSVTSYLLYMPRAIQVGFLSPFPSLWIESGRTPGTSMGRIVLGIVSVFFYICLGFFIWSLRTFGKSFYFWLIVMYSTYGLIVFTYAYPNVGTLLRLRYGFFMVMAGIGLAFAIQKYYAVKGKGTTY